MSKFLITKKRGGLWARLAAFMVVLMMTTAQVNAQTVQVDSSSPYTPTKIINGSFDTEPWMTYTYKSTVYTSCTYPYPNSGNLDYGLTEVVTNIVFNGVNAGWNTTDNSTFMNSLFEYRAPGNHTGDGYAYNSAVPYTKKFIEMNCQHAAALYQDLTTYGGDVIRWTLGHATSGNGGDVQTMHVEIGAPQRDSQGNIVNAYSSNTDTPYVDTKIVTASKAIFRYDGVTDGSGGTSTNGFAGSDIGNLRLEKPTQASMGLLPASGVYIIPAKQAVTRFAFVSDDTKPANGNLLDDITFSTLVGNLQASVSDVGDVTIKGYWGDADSNKKLCVKVGTTVHQINMSSVLNNNFKITFPRTMIGSNTQVDIYHQDYEQAKVRLQFTIKVCTVGTGSSMIYYSSVNEAISKASSGQTVDMIANATENVTVPDGKNITLNLNGFVLKASSTSATTITNNGTLTLTDTAGGGKVTGGATGVQQNGTLTVGGKLNITGNTANLYLPTGRTVAVSSLASGANIGVTTQTTPTDGNPVAITSNGTSADMAYFGSDNADYVINHSSQTSSHLELSTPIVCELYNGETLTDRFSCVQNAVNAAAETGNTIKMIANSTENVTVESGKDITLDLNDYTLTGKDNGTVISNAGILTLNDSSAEQTGKITGAGEGKYGVDNSGTLNLYAGNISGNANGVKQNGDMTVGGTAKITGNTVGGTANNVYLPTGKTITVGTGDKALASDALIGVTTQATPTASTPVAITSNGSSADMAFFSSDNTGYVINHSSLPASHLELSTPIVCELYDGGTLTDRFSCVQNAINGVNETDTIIKMIANSTEQVTIAKDKKLTLDLNDCLLDGSRKGSVITNNGILTVTDSNYGSADSTRYFVYDAYESEYKMCKAGTAGAVEVKGGCITGGYTYGNGAGILNNGILTITAGNICGNNGTTSINVGYSDGGGIMNNKGCTLNVKGGEISCNVAYNVGGVYNEGYMTVESTGKICNNKSYYFGGVCNSGTFNMSGGEVYGNEAKHSCGGVMNNEKAVFTMTGGKIRNNKSMMVGGVGNGGTFTMTGGEVTGNTAFMVIGGVTNVGDMTIGGGAKITGNEVGTSGEKAASTPSNLVIAVVADEGKGGSLFGKLPTPKSSGNKKFPVTISTEHPLTEGNIIGVSIIDFNNMGFMSGAFSTQCDVSNLSHFTNECDYTVMYEGGCLVLDTPVCELTKGDVTLKKSSVTQALADAGEGEASIKMIDNSTENVTVAGNQTINLDLNGCTITDTIGDAITNNGTFTITDTNETTVGEVVATKGNSVAATAGETNIDNGKFNGKIIKGDNAALNITGGKYSDDPTKYLTTTYAAKHISEDPYYYEVVTGDEVVCHDDTHGYSRVQWAVDFQTAAATITMVNNSTENVVVKYGKDITLDLNGKTITSEDKKVNVITNEGGTLTIIDRSEGNGCITGDKGEAASISNLGGILYLYAGNVTGNSCGVSSSMNGTLTLGGKVKITGNTNGNLYLPKNQVFSVGTGDNAPAPGMMVGVTPYKWESGSIITVSTANGTTDYSQYFRSDNEANHFVVYADKEDGYKLKITDDVKVILTADPEGIAEVKIYNATTGAEITDPEHIHYGTMVTIKVTSVEQGYAFKGWFKADGTMFSGKYEYTFKATENLNLTAKFTDAVIWVRVKKGN